jgi:protein ImuB
MLQMRDPRRGLCVAAASPRAWSLGIEPGMTISEATAIAPQMEILPYEPQEDLERLQELSHQAGQFSPLVAIEPLDPMRWAGRWLHEPQGLVLDVTGLEDFFGGTQEMLERVLDWLHQQHYYAVATISNNLARAWAITNYFPRSAITKEWEKLSSEKQSIDSNPHSSPSEPSLSGDEVPSPIPRGIAILEETCELARLPIESLRIDENTCHQLHRLGIRRIHELSRLPRSGLASRFPKLLLDRLQAIHQGDPESMVFSKLPITFEVEQEFEFPTSIRETIQEVLRRLTSQLCDRLQGQGAGALRWNVCLRCQPQASNSGDESASYDPSNQGIAKNQQHWFTLSLYRPTASFEYLWPLLHNQWEQETNPRLKDVCRISMQATLTESLHWKQESLFDIEEENASGLRRYRNDFARLVDTLSNRLGRTCVVAPEVHRNPLPELGFNWRALTGLRKNGAKQMTRNKIAKKAKPLSGAPPSLGLQEETLSSVARKEPLPMRPVHLLEQPKQVAVAFNKHIHPTGGDKQPRSFVEASEIASIDRVLVQRSWGPERIESGWWTGPTQRRDYYHVELNDGRWLWIYRDLSDQTWYLHGFF